jgi:polyphosphate kinase
MVDTEIKNAREGKKASIVVKLNSLEDPSMVAKLYEASASGVKVQLIVRGICCAIPGVEEYSKNIKAISILDRYLEHARIYIFYNDGDERIFLSSADWMIRNLRHRIETAFPIYDPGLKTEIKDFVGIQLADNTKARIIAKGKTNKYRRTRTGVDVQSQIETYKFYKKKSSTQ